MKTRKWNGTNEVAGLVKSNRCYKVISASGVLLAEFDTEDSRYKCPIPSAVETNAALFVDALTTIQKCDLMPSELLKQRDEAIRLLKEHTENGTGYTITQDDINPMLVFLSKIIEQ